VNWKLPGNWKLPDWRSLDRRHWYAISGVAVPIVIVAGLLVLWAAGAFGGGGDGEEQVECSPCPTATATRSPRPTRSPSPSPSETPCCTPPPAETFAPTAPPTQPPTAPPTQPPAPVPQTHGLAPFLSSGAFSRAVDFAIIPGTSNTEAIVVLQKDERILRVSLTGAFEPQLYGDLSNYVGGGGNEEGLLSATFSPDFQNDGRIYVYYTQGAPAPTVLSRFQVSGGAMNTGSETRILEVPDFAGNHNGGRILFGPDGFLYLSLGDGGGGGDPQENGQNLDSLLGKVLRLNVTGQDRYSVPTDNPFVGGGGLDEIWAYGFRNPWRFSFDRATGSLWLGDVGQATFEEVDLVVKGGNYGWDCFEGPVQFEPDGCPNEGFQPPRAAYGTHDSGSCSVTGGYVYRGGLLPELNGRYIYGDYCSGIIWALDSGNPGAQPVILLDSDEQISSFYELPEGELLVLTFGGTIFLLSR
jgi:glucose/arabinose dehydrogenase